MPPEGPPPHSDVRETFTFEQKKSGTDGLGLFDIFGFLFSLPTSLAGAVGAISQKGVSQTQGPVLFPDNYTVLSIPGFFLQFYGVEKYCFQLETAPPSTASWEKQDRKQANRQKYNN